VESCKFALVGTTGRLPNTYTPLSTGRVHHYPHHIHTSLWIPSPQHTSCEWIGQTASVSCGHIRHRPNLSEGDWMTGYGDRANACFVSLTTGWTRSGWRAHRSRQGSPNLLGDPLQRWVYTRQTCHEDQIHPMRSETGMGHANAMARRAAKRRISDIQQEDMTLHRYGDGTGVWDFGRRGRR
jgi:hypothetical protein